MYAAEVSGASRLRSAKTFAAGMDHVQHDCKMELETFDNDEALMAKMQDFGLFSFILENHVQDMQKEIEELATNKDVQPAPWIHSINQLV